MKSGIPIGASSGFNIHRLGLGPMALLGAAAA